MAVAYANRTGGASIRCGNLLSFIHEKLESKANECFLPGFSFVLLTLLELYGAT